MGAEDDVEEPVHAIVDKNMNEYITVHYSKDIEEVEWNILDFAKRNLVAGDYMDLMYRLGVEAHGMTISSPVVSPT